MSAKCSLRTRVKSSWQAGKKLKTVARKKKRFYTSNRRRLRFSGRICSPSMSGKAREREGGETLGFFCRIGLAQGEGRKRIKGDRQLKTGQLKERKNDATNVSKKSQARHIPNRLNVTPHSRKGGVGQNSGKRGPDRGGSWCKTLARRAMRQKRGN